jgi:hypothetical protein
MAFNFKQPFQQVNLPTVNYQPNYRIIVSSLLFLAAMALLLTSCSDKKPEFFVNSTSDSFKKSSDASVFASSSTTSSVISAQIPTKSSFLSLFDSDTDTDALTAKSQDQSYYYTMDVGEYYLKKYYFADDRIKMDKKVAAFIKHPPTSSNPGYYRRYHKVKSDFYKVRNYRKELEKLENKHHGRNHIIASLKPKREAAFQIEAQLFYQLEKINYFAEESYYQWQVFNSYDPKQLVYFERDAVVRSKQTATLFQDFSFALANYTDSAR